MGVLLLVDGFCNVYHFVLKYLLNVYGFFHTYERYTILNSCLTYDFLMETTVFILNYRTKYVPGEFVRVNVFISYILFLNICKRNWDNTKVKKYK